MTDDKKPRKIKDLKARLGRTIAPNTPGADEDVAPAPNLGGPAPAASPAAPATPGAAAPAPQPIAAPAAAKPKPKAVPAPGGLVAPPFAQPKAAPSAPPPADPFAAAAPAAAGPQEVRLVFDDRPVEDEEVGRKKRSRNFLLIGIGLVLGVVLGYGTGSVMNGRKTYNMAVRDGSDLYQAVRTASTKVADAQRLVDQAVTAARGAPGKAPAVDYEAIEALRRIEKPFNANVFSRKNYGLFEPATVDGLFDYYNHINQIWSKIEGLAASTSGEARRNELNEAATAVEGAAALTGCLVAIDEDRYVCNLGYVRIPEEAQRGAAKVFIRASRRARQEAERPLYVGGEPTAGESVILVNSAQSMGVLGEQSSLFAEYVRDMGMLKAMLDETVTLQGTLEQALGQIAANEEVFAF
ncbi:MAG: hypothetical protein KF901_23955 [Myxococcales bacterium]|nr:hypothetical protein [Myxococcales bacterium]